MHGENMKLILTKMFSCKGKSFQQIFLLRLDCNWYGKEISRFYGIQIFTAVFKQIRC